MYIFTSIETSKKLKEMGFPQIQKSYFIIVKRVDGEEYLIDRDAHTDDSGRWDDCDILCNSLTAEEIIEQLPDSLEENDNVYHVTIIKVNNNYWVAYNPVGYKAGCSALISFDGNSMVECLANLWMWWKKEYC